MPHVWCRRHLELPAELRGRRLLLHFRAVDFLFNSKELNPASPGCTPSGHDVSRRVTNFGARPLPP
jgi:hypothetical protein